MRILTEKRVGRKFSEYRLGNVKRRSRVQKIRCRFWSRTWISFMGLLV